ncbi:non-heme iron oxygenase ferredoxin subunit [Thiothrix nivea]|uniref:Rieske (2Fe-2S) iron-sulfur domain-containing protein n=1 Tax=Thiothrix nivea (strain ATCC 35100 / DSM 5205 / JP2) TaxID=870187 RepID=A0A656HEY2_THINJ|nr:non-heme iron oxygenase ferredoxin subunit [Thiothrix nivea]EIJ35641.1 Rieske (2Fe-2S) iron-sulfur domain-containing protein [Thiothrix nivea DSM 5205]
MNDSQLDAGSINEIKPGKMKRVDADNGKRILICHLEDGFYAVDDMCTHEDASLYLGCLHGDRVHCSLHGGEFNVKTGEAMVEPAEIPLQTYPVSIEDGRILVKV